MSLATRCTTCHTVFRVVQDQLKVSEGWVRCGRCGEIFNALSGLLDLDRDSDQIPFDEIGDLDRPPPLPRRESAPAVAPETKRSGPGTHTAIDEAARRPTAHAGVDVAAADAGTGAHPEPGAPAVDRELFKSRRKDGSQSPATPLLPRDRTDFADAQFNTDLLADELGVDAVGSAPALFPPVEAPDAPDFVRHADRRARWHSPRMRASLAVALLLLLATLAVQVAVHRRDELAARHPALAPTLQTLCGWLACRIELPRRIAQVTVENSALSRLSADSEAFRLSITLRNRGDVAVAVPSIELSLTDNTGRLITRRAVPPSDFQGAPSVLPAGSELPLQLVLTTPGAQLTGYTIEIFHP